MLCRTTAKDPGVRCCTTHHFSCHQKFTSGAAGTTGSHHTRCREKAMKASFSQDSQAISGRWLMVINGKWRFSLWTFTAAATDED